ncbi:MlaA family lipoprotein [Undibacterium terreum]|uniref:Phospholipid-binding lipoprotein MlaA n=1 Tax=Undibacterium terreum TaxID=1224302 RepID=A0A916V1A4_9BURK|nr:VacJ family lipoprotein [Undibacterium terreum]GGC99228.1 hypothetical protein GCM10011396_53440 [Undibacterium terreum]
MTLLTLFSITVRKRKNFSALLLLSVLLSGCATGPNANPKDPLEPFNRVVFRTNDKLDQYVAAPLAKGYQKVAPAPVRTAITNFFSNLGDIGNTINSLLQGKGQDAMDSFMRLGVNTVFGLGGLIDIATQAGIPRHSQDFGLTLGSWNIASGPYLVLPLFGPSSFRDGAGQVVNVKLDPVNYTEPPLRNQLYAVNIINTRANFLGATDLLSQAALDPYTFVRDAYLQQRESLIEKGQGKQKLPEYEDPEDKEEAPVSPPSTPPEPSKPAGAAVKDAVQAEAK